MHEHDSKSEDEYSESATECTRPPEQQLYGREKHLPYLLPPPTQ